MLAWKTPHHWRVCEDLLEVDDDLTTVVSRSPGYSKGTVWARPVFLPVVVSSSMSLSTSLRLIRPPVARNNALLMREKRRTWLSFTPASPKRALLLRQAKYSASLRLR